MDGITSIGVSEYPPVTKDSIGIADLPMCVSCASFGGPRLRVLHTLGSRTVLCGKECIRCEFRRRVVDLPGAAWVYSRRGPGERLRDGVAPPGASLGPRGETGPDEGHGEQDLDRGKHPPRVTQVRAGPSSSSWASASRASSRSARAPASGRGPRWRSCGWLGALPAAAERRARRSPRPSRARSGLLMTMALYIRTSTTDQDSQAQLHALRRAAEARGWSNVQEFIDLGHSGSKASRPALRARPPRSQPPRSPAAPR